MYYDAEGDTPQEKINSMRREHYAEHREEILRQQKEAVEPQNQINEDL
jgi:hypothetical protein